MRKRYFQFMRVTEKGAELHPLFEDNPHLRLVRDHINYKRGISPDIHEAVLDSFREGGKPCPFCDESLLLELVTCICCKRLLLRGVKIE